jgi:hypothetical protein
MSRATTDRDAQFTVDALATEGAEPARAPLAPPRAPTGRNAAVLVALALLAGVAGYYLWPRAPATPPAAPSLPASTANPADRPESGIQHPIEQVPGAADVQGQLPALDDSDAVARDSLAAILNDEWMRLVVPEGIVRRIVATVDNLPRQTVAPRIVPVRPVPGAFDVTAAPNGASIAAGNARRYGDYVRAAEAVDTARLVGFYVRLYPLFQQAYAELGYPKGYFNDRVVAVIDHLLAAPEPKGPVLLTQPKVLYQYADADLEQRSAGQKMMMRVGLDNELRLKAKLREIRRALVADAPKQQ